MYRDALDFLEEERAAWTPYEALAELSDVELDRPTDPAGPGHGWCGRDLRQDRGAPHLRRSLLRLRRVGW